MRGQKGVKGSKAYCLLGFREQRGQRKRRGAKGSEGERRGAKGAKGAKGVKGSEAYSMLGFRVPTTWNGKSSITTYSGQMSPPPTNRTTTTCTLTVLQKAFVGPHPLCRGKGWGGKGEQRGQSILYTVLESPPPLWRQGVRGIKE